eukprot:12334185-Ditylum_brightwellii.AAC.1
MYDYFPQSTHAADEAIASMQQYARKLLANPAWTIDDTIVSIMPGASPDPFVHCHLSAFSLSFYYRADVASIASAHYQMARRGWPSLNTTARFVAKYDMEHKEHHHPCITRKIKLLVISGVLTEGHSNTESFGGMLSRLDRTVFHVTYVLLQERPNSTIANFTKAQSLVDHIHIFSKEEQDIFNGAWTNRIAKHIESWEMDIIFYLDLTMSTYARRLGMQRLAPVQINSIGHPITSGHDRSIIQYYISWAAAELPSLEEAQSHYTEELLLLPSDIVYQYYEPRVVAGKQVSRIDGQRFDQFTRTDFGLPPNNNT